MSVFARCLIISVKCNLSLHFYRVNMHFVLNFEPWRHTVPLYIVWSCFNWTSIWEWLILLLLILCSKSVWSDEETKRNSRCAGNWGCYAGQGEFINPLNPPSYFHFYHLVFFVMWMSSTVSKSPLVCVCVCQFEGAAGDEFQEQAAQLCSQQSQALELIKNKQRKDPRFAHIIQVHTQTHTRSLSSLYLYQINIFGFTKIAVSIIHSSMSSCCICITFSFIFF